MLLKINCKILFEFNFDFLEEFKLQCYKNFKHYIDIIVS